MARWSSDNWRGHGSNKQKYLLLQCKNFKSLMRTPKHPLGQASFSCKQQKLLVLSRGSSEKAASKFASWTNWILVIRFNGTLFVQRVRNANILLCRQSINSTVEKSKLARLTVQKVEEQIRKWKKIVTKTLTTNSGSESSSYSCHNCLFLKTSLLHVSTR